MIIITIKRRGQETFVNVIFIAIVNIFLVGIIEHNAHHFCLMPIQIRMYLHPCLTVLEP